MTEKTMTFFFRFFPLPFAMMLHSFLKNDRYEMRRHAPAVDMHCTRLRAGGRAACTV
jgi:hypothetical protein